MKTSKIIIKNLFGIRELALDGKSIEVTGTNGAGKTSVLDAIRYALTNNSERDYIIKSGESEGEILIETDTGLSINRKKRQAQSDYKSIKENGKDVPRPESFIETIFTPLQLNPVEFTQMTTQEQNRIILDLIEFAWDMIWIESKFGEIPSSVNYEQNILKVLFDIQADTGVYFMDRQDINRDIREKQAIISDIAKVIPVNYNFETWDKYDLGEKYKEIEKIKEDNNKIQRAKVFLENYENKKRGIESEKLIAISSAEKVIQGEKESLLASIERMKAEIIAAEDKIKGMASILKDKTDLAKLDYETKLLKLDTDIEITNTWAEKIPVDTLTLSDEIATAEAMKKHLNEYSRMINKQSEVGALSAKSEELTRKIEIARNLPGEILKVATIPVKGLTVKNGVPLINDLPVSNLSEGEKLDLCVDIAISKPSSLQIILLDGTEMLSDENRKRLYQKCRDKGLQFIATRTDNNEEMQVIYL